MHYYYNVTGHVMLLIWLLALYDAHSIMNGTIALGQEDQYEVQHDHVTPLTGISYDANGITNGTIAFLRSRQSK